MNVQFKSLRLFVVLSVLVGLVYPAVVTLSGRFLFPFQSGGSLLISDGKGIGSELIGQAFISPKYFHGRPSAVDYSADNSGGSNSGPSNAKFIEDVKKRVDRIRAENGAPSNQTIAADAVLTSASGLDPHISLEAAVLQVPRVAKARGIAENDLMERVRGAAQKPQMILFGEPCVNVLKLNLMLDQAK